MSAVELVGAGLYAAAAMFWQMFWALVLGFALSGIIIAFVPKRRVARALGRPNAKALGLAMAYGAASSSCSYAAASMTRSLFQKGAHIIPALAFLLASTNLVIELSLVLWLLLGWQFMAAEFLGGAILVGVMAALMRLFGPLEDFENRRRKLASEPEAHEDHHGAVEAGDPRTLAGWRAAAGAFVNEWRMIWKDIALGTLVSGFLMVLVPDSFWQSLFLEHGEGQAGALRIVENALIGPLVSVLSFVCSVGNIPMASVLYHGGISFGGAISFIYADLIIIPLILVYARYFGWRLALWITVIFYASMVSAGIIIQALFAGLGWLPPPHHAMGAMMKHAGGAFALDSTFWLNLAFGAVAAALYLLSRSGGRAEAAGERCCH